MYGYPVYPVRWPVPMQDEGRQRAVEPAERRLAADLLRAVRREERAGKFYAQLAELAPSENLRVLINIIKDERIKHLTNFSQLYRQITGREPQLLREAVPAPESFRKGVELAIRDELESMDSYRDFAEATANPHIRRAFLRAAEDEQRHSTWFSNILISLGS
ncbi:ferritin-like domain-containing protein [Brevibacillus ruminantium]|uniref:Ferritin-like domain-containing protein n=1 Tax=Brevibacillus ruminantium TaxID=2950604 RepID=A0ABY4WBX5_9BACL|nr:ferritin family protein [Brevibacillus ruminantium]USG64685.1 ferritin-like domain-containing protein [Brevibacillus ruminantium]